MLRLALTHREFKGKPVVRAAHWLVMLAFPILFFTLLSGYAQLVDPTYKLPIIGTFAPFEWVTEFFAWAGALGIAALMVIRARNGGILPWRSSEKPGSPAQRNGDPLNLPQRFFGSTRWQAIFVELVILLVSAAILLLRAAEYALETHGPAAELLAALKVHYPLTFWLGETLTGLSVAALGNLIIIAACVKIVVSMAWMAVVGAQTTMGVSWHRFLAPINVFARRNTDGTKALGPLENIEVNSAPLDIEKLDEIPEDAPLGVRKITDFTWKGLLDFDTCTECGRCQELCPAWATGKPLSPKLFTLALRDHHHAAAQYLSAAQELAELGNAEYAEDGTPLIPLNQAETGADGQPPALEIDDNLPQTAHTGDILGALLAAKAVTDDGGVALQQTDLVPHVITPDVLWSCTTCGACVEQCPVDIEHIDHIVDIRRHQVLLESAFPRELAGVFRKLETKSNPYGQMPRKRLQWTQGLEFPVPVIGQDIDSAEDVDYLFWVGCAGAYDDRAQKTSRAVAELLWRAEVSFAVLGQNETCTGDPARRAGNEILFQMLARSAVETLNQAKAQNIVVTCAHCFNSIAREFPELGGRYRVVHHTQLLNQLVRKGRLKPIAPNADQGQKITFHDPCYLGRHNQIYAPPRELLEATGNEIVEMPRNSARAMCCGGGGARAFTEETEGTRIADARITEAAGTGADTVATACPFCTQMLGSAKMLTGETTDSPPTAPAVKDVATLLLDAVKRAD